jgi:hypothetical protein
MLGLGFLRRPTRGEFKVILFCAAMACFAFGIVAVLAGIGAPAEKLLLAHQAVFYGGASIFFGLVFAICLWILCRFSRDT